MTVKEIIKVVATLLGREEVTDYLTGGERASDQTMRAVDLMVRCTNLVISELAGTYIPMTETDAFDTTEIYFSDFKERIVKVLGVFDADGNQKRYTHCPDKIITGHGKTQITYEYIPSNYGIDDVIGYAETDAPLLMLAYGVASELSLIERSFDESVSWRNRFIDALKKVVLPKNKKIKERRWC